MAQLKKIIELN